MKSLKFYSLLMVFFIFSCGRKENNITIFSYSLSHNKIQNLKLNINKSNDIFDFEYLNSKDSTRRLRLKYNLEKDVLISDFDTFLPTIKTYQSQDLVYKIYQTKVVRSHNRTLVFNKDYGLLANITYGANSVFLKYSLSKNKTDLIFKEVFLSLNKINIE